MNLSEISMIFSTAEELFGGHIKSEEQVINKIHEISLGYTYFAQLIGKSCVEKGNQTGSNDIGITVLNMVLDDIRKGEAFPTLERRYQNAIGDSEGRATLLTLLAEEQVSLDDIEGGVSLKSVRSTAQELEIDHMDQLVPRLIDKKFGPALVKKADLRGTYEFLDPVFRAYVRLRR
ncbi:hypothetical protein [Rubrimonas cliftonensis]|uniref:hypothetical protein n=1 Tax=Rubrimonas cliftonensis TaxID=89524 RepID=UPI001114B18D|nr:hypothetical protein [Rubrimonas cliftonensis]